MKNKCVCCYFKFIICLTLCLVANKIISSVNNNTNISHKYFSIPNLSLVKINEILNIDSIKTNKKIELYVSGGVQVGLWHALGMTEIPYHLHIDKKVNNLFYMGLGYSNDTYNPNNLGYIINRQNYIRQNYRLRIYNYFNNDNKPLAGYAGGSIGLSFWSGKNNSIKVFPAIPSVQLFIGFKAKINSSFFNQTEFSMGAPYLFQTSFGYKF
jgi:hypothetical protein